MRDLLKWKDTHTSDSQTSALALPTHPEELPSASKHYALHAGFSSFHVLLHPYVTRPEESETSSLISNETSFVSL